MKDQISLSVDALIKPLHKRSMDDSAVLYPLVPFMQVDRQYDEGEAYATLLSVLSLYDMRVSELYTVDKESRVKPALLAVFLFGCVTGVVLAVYVL